MPYIQSPYGIDWHDCGWVLRRNGGQSAQNTDGWLEELEQCDECGESVCRDETVYCEGYDCNTYCSSCVSYCEECSSTVPDSDYDDGMCTHCASKLPKCERCSDRIREDDCSGETTRGELHCEDCLSDHTRCEECDLWHPTRDGACPECCEPCEGGDCPNDALPKSERPRYATRALCEECQSEADEREAAA